MAENDAELIEEVPKEDVDEVPTQGENEAMEEEIEVLEIDTVEVEVDFPEVVEDSPEVVEEEVGADEDKTNEPRIQESNSGWEPSEAGQPPQYPLPPGVGEGRIFVNTRTLLLVLGMT